MITVQAHATTEITVSAALSLKAPFEVIGRLYEKKYPASKVRFNFAASGILQKQIEAGAPADVFASASPKEMDALQASGLLFAGSRSEFASNSIVLITAINSPVRLITFGDLKQRDVKRIAIGNPATVPAGMYAEETLKTLGLRDKLGEKLVFGEHVRQVMDYVARNEVEAGMVFLTDAISRSRELKVVAEAQYASHRPVSYLIAAVRETKNKSGAQSFIELVLSPEGKEVLQKYGFKTIP